MLACTECNGMGVDCSRCGTKKEQKKAEPKPKPKKASSTKK